MIRSCTSEPRLPIWLVAVGLAASLALPRPATADLDTDPYLFTDQAPSPTGQVAWDEFAAAAGFGGPHAPDVAATGTGEAALTATGVPQPMDGPPFGLVAGTQNLYTGGTIGHFAIDLTGLSTDEANTTVVLQLAALGAFDPASLLLDGEAPTSLVDRGVAPGVVHDLDGTAAASDTNYFWAEWQVPSASDYSLQFSGADTHLSLTGARVDYYNTAGLFDAVEAFPVPEPSSIALAAVGLVGVLLTVSRRRWRMRGVAEA